LIMTRPEPPNAAPMALFVKYPPSMTVSVLVDPLDETTPMPAPALWTVVLETYSLPPLLACRRCRAS
jgi:hypothetical protein